MNHACVSARTRATAVALLSVLSVAGCGGDSAGDLTGPDGRRGPRNLPTFIEVQEALDNIVAQDNAGLGFNMWATIVDRAGVVQVLTFSGDSPVDQWPGSRVISAQKANTANAFSLTAFALSTANLYAATQPGGSLFGLQESNPVDITVAYDGKIDDFGTIKDPLVGHRIGGVNVFGGGLALYSGTGDGDRELVGALGVSGDTSCTDHIIGWKLRDALNLDNVPAGVSSTGDDNIIHDITDGSSAGGFGHPECDGDGTAAGIAADLPTDFPVAEEEAP
ncbi:MAG: GlcG/HbpS family heme-binding protein [Gemmatimonadales bacterium]